MFDYRLKVFYTVAQRLSFTKAAEELNISQPAVTKHIKEIEHQLQTKLFHRNGTTIQLTESGILLSDYAKTVHMLSRDLEYALAELGGEQKGRLRIGASTTVAQYILPEILARFRAAYREITVELLTHNTERITELLISRQIDLGIVEGATQSSHFDYEDFRRDEIVLVAKAGHQLARKTLSPKDLYNIDLVTREPGSGTQEFIRKELKKAGVDMQDLHIVMQLGSSESLKSYLQHSEAMAFLSVHTILPELKHQQLAVIDIKRFSIERKFKIITLKGESSPLIRLFLKFLHYNR